MRYFLWRSLRPKMTASALPVAYVCLPALVYIAVAMANGKSLTDSIRDASMLAAMGGSLCATLVANRAEAHSKEAAALSVALERSMKDAESAFCAGVISAQEM